MVTKQTIKLSGILAVCTLFIFCFSYYGGLGFATILNQKQSFDEDTYIGSINVSHKSREEAVQIVQKEIDKWFNETTIHVQYKEKMISIDPKIISFQIQESVERADDGQNNSLLVTSNKLETNISEISSSVNNTIGQNLTLVKQDILKKASQLESGLYSINLEDYVLNQSLEDNMAINSTVKANLSKEARDAIKSIGEIEITPVSKFSLLEHLEGTGTKYVSNETLSILASGIYESILQTNFPILERNISESLPSYAKLGYEAKINVERKMDLSFMNPNQSTYRLKFYPNNDHLVVSLTGPSFLYQYKAVKKDIKTIHPKIIVEFNPRLFPGQKSVKKIGKNGRLIKMNREIYDETGGLINKERISEDFYPPIHQIEVNGLIISEENDNEKNGNTSTSNSNNTADNQTTDQNKTNEQGKQPDQSTSNASNDGTTE